MNVVKSMFGVAYSLLESDLTQYTTTHHLLETTDYTVIMSINMQDKRSGLLGVMAMGVCVCSYNGVFTP